MKKRLPVGLALSLVFLVACGSDPGDAGRSEKVDEAPFTLLEPPVGGKADEAASLLSSAELSRLERVLTQAIDLTDGQIAALDAEIVKLELDSQRKLREIDDVIRRIEQRKLQVQQEWNDKRNICLLCIFGGCAPVCWVSLAGMMADDRVLQDLNRQLDGARRRQQDIQAQMNDYVQRRDAMRSQLELLRTAQGELWVRLEGAPGSPPPELAGDPELARMVQRVALLEGVLSNSQEQVEILLRIRELAQALSDALDEAVGTLRALASAADEAVRASRRRTWDLLITATSPDPGASASAWLEDEVARITKAKLRAMGWPVGDFVEALLASRGSGDIPLDELAEDLLAALLDDVAVGTTRLVNSEASAIHDRATTTSAIRLEGAGRVREAAVEVDIRHTYVGDLVLWVTHGGESEVVHDRLGGGHEDLRQRFPLNRFSGLPAAGEWWLHIADEADFDEGSLIEWTLEVSHGP